MPDTALIKRALPLLKDPLHAISLGFGSGLSPVAPGTFGTVAAIPLYLAMSYLTLWQYWLLLLILIAIGILACGRTAEALGVHDAGIIVWDEVVGFLLTMGLMPDGWQWLLTGFVLFRFFDIIKPWPIRTIDKHVGGGLGIVLDDLIAGVFALLVMTAAEFWLVPLLA